jgi:hypothetical protein
MEQRPLKIWCAPLEQEWSCAAAGPRRSDWPSGYGIRRIRLSEVVSKVDEATLEETTVERVRMITPAEWRVFEREGEENSSTRGDDEWKEVARGVNPLGFVPVVPIPLGRYHRP